MPKRSGCWIVMWMFVSTLAYSAPYVMTVRASDPAQIQFDTRALNLLNHAQKYSLETALQMTAEKAALDHHPETVQALRASFLERLVKPTQKAHDQEHCEPSALSLLELPPAMSMPLWLVPLTRSVRLNPKPQTSPSPGFGFFGGR